METTVKEISQTQREIEIEISAESVAPVYNQVVRKYSSKANVPGFRKGLVPVEVVKLRFANEIKQEVIDQLARQAAIEAIQQNHLHPVAEPHFHIEDLESLRVDGSRPVKMQIHLEVMPEVPAPEYEKIEVKRRIRKVSDDEIERQIEELRKRQAALVPVENRGAESGDTVIVDLEGKFIDQPDQDPISAKDVDIALGEEGIDERFTSNLIGAKPDEERQFTIGYDKDYAVKDLAGKTVQYTAKIKSVGRLELPDADDEWVKSLDQGVETLDELREKVQENLQAYYNAETDARLRNDAVEALVETHQFEVPKALIENQTRILLEEFVRDLQSRGVDPSKIQSDAIEGILGQLRQRAEREVRGALLLGKIAETEKISVSESELEEELKRLSTYYSMSVEELKNALSTSGRLESVEDNLRTRQAIEKLLEKIKIAEVDFEETASQEEAVADENSTDDGSQSKTKKAAARKKAADESTSKKTSYKKSVADASSKKKSSAKAATDTSESEK
ncbi:MAG TPA: trigger factor [Pyrinomonadaceae bacterium]|nr:trigger factor [Pyrinomonadaceae bacterium]